jgi:hypothetical protein
MFCENSSVFVTIVKSVYFDIVQQHWPGTSLTFVKVTWIKTDQYLSNISIYLLTSLVSEVWCIGIIEVGLRIWRSLIRFLINTTLWFFLNFTCKNYFEFVKLHLVLKYLLVKWCFHTQLYFYFITVAFKGSLCDIMQSYML